MSQQYWPLKSALSGSGFELEMRSAFAWRLLEKYAIVAGHVAREDSCGRSVTDLLPVPDAVDRAFALADAFVSRAEARGELRAITEERNDEAYREGGRLQRLRDDAHYPKDRWKDSVGAEQD